MVPSTLTAFQMRQTALNNLVAQRQSILSQRQSLLGQRQANLLASRQIAQFSANPATFAGLTPGGFGMTSPNAFSTSNTGMFGFGSSFGSNLSNPRFANNLSTTMFANNPSTTSYANYLTNAVAAANGNPSFGNVVGTGLSNYFGPFANTQPSVTNSLFSTNTFGNSNFGGLGLGAAYARSGAYDFGSLYNTYVGSGAFGGPYSAGFGGVFFA
ncbi:MAG TPA: hypothetical protein VFT74_02855 [Isosphaeraceae bacterium]|nr:hypothetical protein [Isosphaeraceae bacterium]